MLVLLRYCLIFFRGIDIAGTQVTLKSLHASILLITHRTEYFQRPLWVLRILYSKYGVDFPDLILGGTDDVPRNKHL